jgi:hypothetical protein
MNIEQIFESFGLEQVGARPDQIGASNGRSHHFALNWLSHFCNPSPNAFHPINWLYSPDADSSLHGARAARLSLVDMASQFSGVDLRFVAAGKHCSIAAHSDGSISF